MDTEWKYKYLVSYHNSILLFNSISYFFIILFFFLLFLRFNPVMLFDIYLYIYSPACDKTGVPILQFRYSLQTSLEISILFIHTGCKIRK